MPSSAACAESRSVTRPVLVATRNSGKLRELLPWFAAAGLSIETLDDAALVTTPEEDDLEMYDTFEGNALAKARWFFSRSDGRVVVAEDSGLEVDALHGAPGVRSKRWSGRSDLVGEALDTANNVHLLTELAGVPVQARTARYVCAAACVWSMGAVVVRGETAGRITLTGSGAHGFGYDPYFYADDLSMTFAEAERDAKTRVSHRGRAFTALLAALRTRGVL